MDGVASGCPPGNTESDLADVTSMLRLEHHSKANDICRLVEALAGLCLDLLVILPYPFGTTKG
jgi:hypothetical protein